MERTEYSQFLDQSCKGRSRGAHFSSSNDDSVFMGDRAINDPRESGPRTQSRRTRRAVRGFKYDIRGAILLTDAEERPHVGGQSATHDRSTSSA